MVLFYETNPWIEILYLRDVYTKCELDKKYEIYLFINNLISMLHDLKQGYLQKNSKLKTVKNGIMGKLQRCW